jgi:PAS domain S-box-containing protein
VTLRLVRACRLSAFGTSAAIALAAVTVLAGWAFGIHALTTSGARGVSMNPLTAVCFLLLAAALQFMLPQAKSDAEIWTARAIAAGAGALALLKLARLGSVNGPDTWMFRASIEALTPVNRMAPNTALILVLLAAAILMLDTDIRGRRPSQWLVLLALPVTLVVLLGFLFGVGELFGWGAYIPMARNTAVALVGLELAILASRVEFGITRIFVASGSGGVTARRLLPAAVLLPLVLGYARILGQRAGLYGTEFGIVLFSLAMVAALSSLVWWTASDVARIDAAREEVDMRLQALIRHNPLGIVVLDTHGRVQLCNDAFVELFHYPRADLLGRRVDDLIAPDDDGGETRSMTERGVAGEHVRRATVRRRRDGRLIDVELFVVPLEVNGMPVGTYGVYRDLTAQRRAETRRREAPAR